MVLESQIGGPQRSGRHNNRHLLALTSDRCRQLPAPSAKAPTRTTDREQASSLREASLRLDVRRWMLTIARVVAVPHIYEDMAKRMVKFKKYKDSTPARK
jgi:hypothetical protein